MQPPRTAAARFSSRRVTSTSLQGRNSAARMAPRLGAAGVAHRGCRRGRVAQQLGRQEWRTAEGSGGGALPEILAVAPAPLPLDPALPQLGPLPPMWIQPDTAGAGGAGQCLCRGKGRQQGHRVSSSPPPAPFLDGHCSGDPSTGGSWVACHGKSEAQSCWQLCFHARQQ